MDKLPQVTSKIRLIEIPDNRSDSQAYDRELTMAQYQQLLQDAGRVDSPLLASLGYPIIIVSTKPGQKCIPQAQLVPTGRSKEQNRTATVAAARLNTGLALGCVMGHVYVLRTDGTDLTAAEWWRLWDALIPLVCVCEEERGVTEAVLAEHQASLKKALQEQGLWRPKGPGSGAHCFACGAAEGEAVQLKKCLACRTAWYCSKDCQTVDWKGHKQACRRRQTPQQAQAGKVQVLMETAVLKPEQIIRLDAPMPEVPDKALGDFPRQQLSADQKKFLRLSWWNKHRWLRRGERICPGCMTHYRLEDPLPDTQCAREQELTGICSYRCFNRWNPPGGRYHGPDWYGQEAQEPEFPIFFGC